MTREAFESALDRGLLETLIVRRDGKHWYKCRRGGQTRTWKRSPERFVIPVKYRFRDSFRVTESHFNIGLVDEWFRILHEARAGGPKRSQSRDKD